MKKGLLIFFRVPTILDKPACSAAVSLDISDIEARNTCSLGNVMINKGSFQTYSHRLICAFIVLNKAILIKHSHHVNVLFL